MQILFFHLLHTQTHTHTHILSGNNKVHEDNRHGKLYGLCCVLFRFLDNRLFATCSDDTTIALWDLRKLNSKVCTLHGHASWVKNIEYDTHTRLLVTSGFDGNVITWDTNRYV